MPVDQILIDAAVRQMRIRRPSARGAVAAAVYLDDGSILTGVSLDNINAAMTLCAETGPICQAYTLDKAILASVCVAGEDDGDGFRVLAPCGACQERLAVWGTDVEVGVADSSKDGGWTSRRLVDLNPYYWAEVFAQDAGWPSPAEHAS
jgi:cytidine deaminase